MDMENILSGLVRIGTVTDTDSDKHMARVKYQGESMTSGWLYVLQHTGYGVTVPEAGGHGHNAGIAEAGSHTHGGTAADDGSHRHTVTVEEEPDHTHERAMTIAWMPSVNDTVLVLYMPVWNSDGFILGVIG